MIVQPISGIELELRHVDVIILRRAAQFPRQPLASGRLKQSSSFIAHTYDYIKGEVDSRRLTQLPEALVTAKCCGELSVK